MYTAHPSDFMAASTRPPTPNTRVDLGRVTATAGACDAVDFGDLMGLLGRHGVGDWGCLEADEWVANEALIASTTPVGQLRSVYTDVPSKHNPGQSLTVWITTDNPYSSDALTLIKLPGE